jgi:flagellar hook-associated protein 3 FlgL
MDRISSYGGAISLGYRINTMQSQLNQLVAEESSGQKTNPAASMGTSAALLYQLQSQSDQQTGLQTALTLSSQRLDTAQTALTSLASTVQTVALAAQGITAGGDSGLSAVGSQATSTISQVLSLLNTGFLGAGVFGGNSGVANPMKAADAPGGLSDITQNILGAAVSANGAPLSQSDINALINGPNGIASVFNDTNSDPAQRYSGAIYSGSTDSQPTKAIIGTNQTEQYDSSASQPAFRNLLKGLSLLSMLNAPSSQIDDTGKTELLSQANTLLGAAQQQLTTLQGGLGTVQASLSSAVTAQQSAASATQAQILTYVQADSYGNATQISTLQTQLQATYSLTSQISQLTLVHYLPTN